MKSLTSDLCNNLAIFDLPQFGGLGFGSFPWAHASMAFCGAALVHKAYRFKGALAFYLFASAVGAARVCIDKHYFKM